LVIIPATFDQGRNTAFFVGGAHPMENCSQAHADRASFPQLRRKAGERPGPPGWKKGPGRPAPWSRPSSAGRWTRWKVPDSRVWRAQNQKLVGHKNRATLEGW